MKKIKSVAIYKPTEVSVFEVGALLMHGETKTTIAVKKISINIFRTVTIHLSDGHSIIFNGLPISYEI